MSSNRSVTPNPPDHDDTLEAHYSALERGVPCYCYGSGVVVLSIEEDGQEFDDVVPCRRCSGNSR